MYSDRSHLNLVTNVLTHCEIRVCLVENKAIVFFCMKNNRWIVSSVRVFSGSACHFLLLVWVDEQIRIDIVVKYIFMPIK